MGNAAVVEQPGAVGMKTPKGRLLDMLAGWERYALKDEDEGIADAPGVTDRIGDLYQEAGHLADGNSEEAVRTFLLERVLPLLCR